MTDQQPAGGARAVGGAESGGTELGRYLRARRAQLTPADVGLPTYPGLRRTPGLRREELATLAGISNDYYIRLERGREARPSPEVVNALARALRLDEGERDHLRALVAQSAHRAEEPTPPTRTVPSEIQILLDSMRPCPAHIVARNGDLLAWNPGGLHLFAGIESWPIKQRNVWRYVFLHPFAPTVFDDWQSQIRGCVRHLRALSGLEPDAPDLTSIVGELAVKSPEFARLWDRYDVAGYNKRTKTFHHPQIGTVTLRYQSMQLDGSRGQSLVAYWAQPGTPAHDGLLLLDQVSTISTATTVQPETDPRL